MWLITRIIQLSYLHVTPEEPSSDTQFCAYIAFQHLPVFFFLNCALIIAFRLYEEFHIIAIIIKEGIINEQVRKKRCLFALLACIINNAAWTLISVIEDCKDISKFFTPDLYYLVQSSLLCVLLFAVGLSYYRLFSSVDENL